MSWSGGDSSSAAACVAQKPTIANAPNGSSQRGRTGVRWSAVTVELMSFLDHVLERKQRADEEDDVVYDEQADPGAALSHDVAVENRAGRLHRAYEQRDQHRKQQQWQQHFACAQPTRHR